jgi:hypothetical protein
MKKFHGKRVRRKSASSNRGGNGLFFQPKLTVGPVGDGFEREADRVADEVTKPANTNAISSNLIAQRKCAACEEEQEVQRKEDGNSSADDLITTAIGSGGQPIESNTRTDMENRFGYDFSNVKIHSDAVSAKSAQSINARAYTSGSDIVFNQGEYSPTTGSGQKLLAHELTHVIQQSQSPTFTAQRVIQRMPCAPLLNSPTSLRVGGTAAHGIITADFHSRVKDAVKIFIPGASAAPQRTEGSPRNPNQIDPQKITEKAGKGFPDLAKKTAGILEVAEIKPATWTWVAEGAAQLARYVSNGNDADPQIAAWRTTNAITSVTPMLPTSYSPPSTLVVGTTPIQVAWCGPGLIVYRPMGGDEEFYKLPEYKPVPVWDKVLFLAMVAAMAAAAKKFGMKLHPGVRAAAMAAMIFLLASGKAEAKISLSGDDPLEALFKAMEQDGVTVPDEVKEMIKNDPELRKMMEDSAKKGNMSEAQKEAARKYTEYLSKHMDEFSREELEALLSTTENASDKMPGDLNVEDIKKALKNKIDQKEKQEGGSGQGTGAKDDKATDKEKEKEKEKDTSKLSESSRKLLNEARPELKNLFDAWLKKQEGGTLTLTDEIVQKFFSTIPSDLSTEDSEYLIASLIPGGTLDESLAKMKKVIEERKKAKEEKTPGDKPADSSAPEGDTAPGPDNTSKTPKDDAGGIPVDEYIKAMVARIKKKNFSKFSGFEIVRGGKKTTLESKKGEIFDAVFYQWVNYTETTPRGVTKKKLKTAAVITVECIGVDPVSVKVISSGGLVFETGERQAGVTVGRVFTQK